MSEGKFGLPRPFTESDMVLQIKGLATESVTMAQLEQDILDSLGEIRVSDVNVESEDKNILVAQISLGDDIIIGPNVPPASQPINRPREEIEAVYESKGIEVLDERIKVL